LDTPLILTAACIRFFRRLTGLAGILLLFNNRMTSAEPISVAFSGEVAGMVIIGGMRSFLGPALGALFFVIFRDNLSRLTETGCFFSACCSSRSSCSRERAGGFVRGLTAPCGVRVTLDAAMAARQAGRNVAAAVPQARRAC